MLLVMHFALHTGFHVSMYCCHYNGVIIIIIIFIIIIIIVVFFCLNLLLCVWVAWIALTGRPADVRYSNL